MDLINSDSEDLIIGIIVFTFFIGIFLCFILCLITQQNILKSIQRENRLMSPGEVWLQLIPLFGYIWQFIVVNRIADSIRREYESWQNDSILGLSDASAMYLVKRRPTADIGIAASVLLCCGIIPVLGYLAILAGVICRIIYWIRLIKYKGIIERRVAF